MKTKQIDGNLNNTEINIKISDDLVLTSLSCATIINEILKNLLYQRSQIPYTYNHLRTIIDRKRQTNPNNNGINNKNLNFNLTNHYRIVSNFYDNLEIIMLNICNLFKLSSNICRIREILFVLGTTPICPKEIFIIRLNDIIDGHLENYHLLECKKNQHKVLRKIFLSETWIESTINASSISSCTNFYIFLKTTKNIEMILRNDTNLLPCKPLIFNSNYTKHFIVNLTIDKHQKYNCCNNLGIFNDDEQELPSPSIETSCSSLSSTTTTISDMKEIEEFWYQSKISLQGFKDCFINKISASELW